jgi:hypothetical protein
MRSLIVIAALASLTAGPSFAQYGVREPSAPPATQSELGTPPTATRSATPDPGPAVTETQAKSRIEDQGFTNVSGLKKDAKGEWNARAMKDGKPVQLSLDTQGHITQLN